MRLLCHSGNCSTPQSLFSEQVVLWRVRENGAEEKICFFKKTIIVIVECHGILYFAQTVVLFS